MKQRDEVIIYAEKPAKPKDGDAYVDHTMRPPRVRQWHRRSGEWLTDDEYAYRTEKQNQPKRILH